jgi:hypothetical protein
MRAIDRAPTSAATIIELIDVALRAAAPLHRTSSCRMIAVRVMVARSWLKFV